MILDDELVKSYLNYHNSLSYVSFDELKDFFVCYEEDGQILEEFILKSELAKNKKPSKRDYALFSIDEEHNFTDDLISKAKSFILEGKDEGLILSSLMRLFKRV